MSGDTKESVVFENMPAQPGPAAMSDDQKIKHGICPVCDNKLAYQEGCKLCYACGWGGCTT